MKVVVIGDIHGTTSWKNIINQEENNQIDKYVFLGDYFDSHEGIAAEQQMNNFLDIIEYKNNNPNKVIMLVGNHDYHYLDVGEQYSGYQNNAAPAIKYILYDNINKLQICYRLPLTNILCSHAGVTRYFLKRFDIENNIFKIEHDLNDLFKYKPLSFKFFGSDPYGDNITQGPLWVRPKSLIKNSIGMIQIVGHTMQNSIVPKHINDHKNRIWCIDTLATSQEYLLIDDEEFIVKKIEEI